MGVYEVISADGHLEVPIDLWIEWVPRKFRDDAPRLVFHDDGTEWWQVGNHEVPNDGNLICGLPYDEFVEATHRYRNSDGSLRPGCGDAVQRLREQDVDGIDAEILFPPIYMRQVLLDLLATDKDCYLAIVKAFNSFLGEQFCTVAPDRLIANAVVPESGVEDAVKEMERCRGMGLRTMSPSMWPNGGRRPAEEDDRFWAASIDIGMKVSPHGNLGGSDSEPGHPPVRLLTDPGRPLSVTIGQFVVSGVFDRFPDLGIYFAETDASWLPYTLNKIDGYYQVWHHHADLHLQKMPSEYYRDHCRFSFIRDPLAVRFRNFIGMEKLMWGSDHPHAAGTFPYSREFLADFFAGVPESDRKQILCDNVVDFFDLDPDSSLTPTPVA